MLITMEQKKITFLVLVCIDFYPKAVLFSADGFMTEQRQRED